MKQTLSIIIVLLFFNLKMSGQIPHPIKELSIGDTLPNLVLKHLLVSSRSHVKVANLYKHGILIIDFWATWCDPCIEEMKLLNSIKNKYADSLNVLFVGYEKRVIIQAFFDRHKNIPTDKFNITTDDADFVKLFYHQALPHNVWIDQHGVIKAITGGEEITTKNISSFLAGNFKPSTYKKDFPFDTRKPLHISDSLIQYRSIFNTYVNTISLSGNVMTSLGFDKPNMSRFFIFNLSLTDLYWEAFKLQTGGNIPNYNLIELHTKDSIKFYNPRDNPELFKRSKYRTIEEWNLDNLYSYELRLPKPVKDSLFYSYVQQDLERNTNISGKIKIKEIKCFDVSVKSNPFKPSQIRYPKISIKHDTLYVKDATMRDLLNYITSNTFGRRVGRNEPYYDSTGMNSPFNCSLYLGEKIEWKNVLAAFEAKMADIGFKFREKLKPYPILVLTDYISN